MQERLEISLFHSFLQGRVCKGLFVSVFLISRRNSFLNPDVCVLVSDKEERIEEHAWSRSSRKRYLSPSMVYRLGLNLSAMTL